MSTRGYVPSQTDVTATGTHREALLSEAREITRNRFGDRIFVRGVLEVSNFCRQNCTYCGMRRDHRDLFRSRSTYQQLAELVSTSLPQSITDLNLQAGEDPVVVRDTVLPLIRLLRRDSKLGLSVCLGSLPQSLYRELQSAGASIYIMKFETGDPLAYKTLQAPHTLPERLNHIRALAGSGWSVTSGFIAGLPGQRPADLVNNITLASSLPIRGCSVSPFIAGENTPLSQARSADAGLAINSIAMLRLTRADWVIPAVSALNISLDDGYRQGLRAGANLATINLTPERVRGDYLIYKRDRFIMTEQRVLSAIESEGLTISDRSLADYFQSGARNPSPSLRA